MKMSPPPTGRKIVLELVKEMEDGLYPLLYRKVPPTVYHVYLHPDDYSAVAGIAPLIVVDAQKALSARVAALNRRFQWLAPVLGKPAPIEAPPNGWEIHVQAEANATLARGEIGIESRLIVPPPARYDGGTPTTRVVRTVITAAARRSSTVDEPSGGSHTEPAGVATVTAKAPIAALGRHAEDIGGFARLEYVDEQGSHVFTMKKDLITIGRGGRDYWVDVQITTTARVSREHCRIRRDGAGRFFLQDLSTWGTAVDGQPVARPANGSGTASGETRHEHELPHEALIHLADAVVVQFRAQPFS